MKTNEDTSSAPDRSALHEQHQPEAIRQRLKEGGELSGLVIVVLGFSNLLADGFSMAASNYLGVKSEREEVSF